MCILAYSLAYTAPSSPLEPRDLIAVDITFNSAMILWTVLEISYTTETYVVRYGLQDDQLTNASAVVSGGTDFLAINQTMTVQLTDLVHSSTYFYLVEASNTEGMTRTPKRTFKTSNARE